MRNTLFLIGLFLASLLSAQDARFTQWAATPQLVNPALTGVMDGKYRFTANFRELYASRLGNEGLQSVAAGFEMRGNARNGNSFGWGLQVQQDQGGSGDLRRNQALLSASYQQDLGRLGRSSRSRHFLSGGAQFGVGTRGVDVDKLLFSNQYFVDNATRDAYLDTNLPTGENFSGLASTLYLDASAGLAYFAVFGDRRSVYGGVAAYHLNRPDIAPVDGRADQLSVRYAYHLGGELPLGAGEMSLLPTARLLMQRRAYDALVGANLRYSQRDWREVALRAGLFAQVNNSFGFPDLHALIVTVGLETEQLQFGLAYDVSVNNIGTVNDGRGGWELSVIYVRPGNRRDRVICPKF